MLRFALRRATVALLTLSGVVTLVFVLMAAAPGDPARLALRGSANHSLSVSPEAVEAFRRSYGLDRPLPARFAIWVGRAVRFDFGRSFLDGREVGDRVADTLPATLVLNAGALVLALLAAVPCGVLAARRPGRTFDRLSGFLFDALFATPSFVLGMLLLLVFAVKLRWFPLFADSAWGIRGLALPMATLALTSIGPLARFVRVCVGDALRAPASRAGRARGEGTWEETRRALRRSAVPFAAMGAAILPGAVSGSVLVERLFSLPGTGGLLADAVFARDYPTVLAITLLVSTVVVLGSLAADIVSAILDPRMRDLEPLQDVEPKRAA